MRRLLIALLTGLTLVCAASSAPATAKPVTEPVAVGTGGAAASVDPLATQTAIDVLRAGGNAVDAAVAAAAVLGVTEPYSCGIGGGGFFVIYHADRGRVSTIDSRETAPQAFTPETFLDPSSGQPIPFAELVTSGLGVGVPGTVRGWQRAVRRYGTMELAELLRPAIAIAENGFAVDETFAQQTASNLARFRDFTSTRELFLTPGGDPPAVGSLFRNPELAATYRLIADRGARALYTGRVAQAIVDTVQHPPLVPGSTRNARAGLMTLDDLAAYRAPLRAPVATTYRGFEIYGMGPPSSGGSTVAEALNILEGFDLAGMDRVEALHLLLESSRFSFADRNGYVGDPEHVYVPLTGLISKGFAAERRALIGPFAATSPVAPGYPWPYETGEPAAAEEDDEGISTTHLTVSDRWGNVVSYTFTIESIGGSGMVVPGYGFLLNNELTDFETRPDVANSPGPGKRPRSSMSPTIVLADGRPLMALGSPGGATIITTVLQLLVNQLDFGMTLPEAIAAPRLSQRNTTATSAEPGFLASPEADALSALGHSFAPTAEIGAATAVAFLPGGLVQAAAEPVRRGAGSAMVEEPVETAPAARQAPAGAAMG